jgi:hypothetical protein
MVGWESEWLWLWSGRTTAIKSRWLYRRRTKRVKILSEAFDSLVIYFSLPAVARFVLSRLKPASLTRMAESISIKLPPNPKLTPGMVLKIPEIPGLPFGRTPPAPTAKTPPSGSAPVTPAKTEPSEDGLSANPARGATRVRMANSLWRYRPSTVFRD